MGTFQLLQSNRDAKLRTQFSGHWVICCISVYFYFKGLSKLLLLLLLLGLRYHGIYSIINAGFSNSNIFNCDLETNLQSDSNSSAELFVTSKALVFN